MCLCCLSAEKPDGARWWAEFQGFGARAATLVVWGGGEINIVENPHSHSLNDYMPSRLIIKGSLAPHNHEREREREMEMGLHLPAQVRTQA